MHRSLPSREIEHFGSRGFAHTRLGRGADWQVSLVRLDGLIGRARRVPDS